MLLNCHTYYSFCYGTFSVEELLSTLIQNGYTQFVLSDINNTSATLTAVEQAKKLGIKPIIGIDFRNGVEQKYIGIAINNQGFRQLNEHLTHHLHHNLPFHQTAPPFTHAFVIYPSKTYQGWPLRENEYVGITPKELTTLAFMSGKQKTKKLVVLQPVSFTNKLQFNAHRLLRAIDKNTLLSKLPLTEQTTIEEIIPHHNQLYAAYAPYPQIIVNTEYILNTCSIDFEYGKLSNKNLKCYTGTLGKGPGSIAQDVQLLRSETIKGLSYRFKNPSQAVLQRIEKELQVIQQINFSSYFLINWDIIQYAQRKNYYYVGRGSGANSMVAYLLRITDVDPIDLDLYFERFINIHRSNAPDFDMDFSWTDRDDITNYIFNRFGHERTALVGAYNTFKHDSVIRELGKVFGLPDKEIEKLQASGGFTDSDELGKLVLRYSKVIHGFPSHLSVHSSGILISEQPISCYTATNMPPKGYPVTQFSMLEAEDIGLYKFDILSQRGLGKIKDSLAVIKENKGVDLDIHNVAEFKKDEKIKELLRVGKTIGCFYVESPAMRMLLAKLKADDYLRLVAASSIIRPGVAKSGMMREYIVRFRDETLREKARKQLPELYDLLEETYGVMVYQEDVIKVAHFFAGLTLAEADYLRKGMSWKSNKRAEFASVKNNFFDNCRKKNYHETLILNIWNQIESFANFAFSKGHSASYAVESYQALFIKAYYPLEYMVATLNNGGGYYRKELYVHEARMHGATIMPPCVNTSEALCVIKDTIIYIGLSMISELEHEVIRYLLKERNENGLFESMYDFVKRVPISIEQARLLIRIGAFDFTTKSRKELLWEIHTLLNPNKKREYIKELFDVKPTQWQLPQLESSYAETAFVEMESLGFSLCSPFDLLKEELPSKLTARELLQNINKTVTIVGYRVSVKNTATSKGERMFFGTFVDTEGNWIDTVHFPDAARDYPFSGPGCYVLSGKVTEEFDFVSIEIQTMKRMEMIDRDTMEKPVKSN